MGSAGCVIARRNDRARSNRTHTMDRRIDQRLIRYPFLERAGLQAHEIALGDTQRFLARSSVMVARAIDSISRFACM